MKRTIDIEERIEEKNMAIKKYFSINENRDKEELPIKSYFTTEENFDEIIKNTLKNKEIIQIKPITTGWTNIVFEVTTNRRKLLFSISKR